MTDQTKELLSILIDGEASEIEIHRLLKQMKLQTEPGDQTAAIASWVSYQETRQVLRNPANEQRGTRLSSDQHLDLFQRISEAVGSEDESFGRADAVKRRPPVNYAMMKKPLAGLAMAASLVVAVFVGMQINPSNTSPSGQLDNLAANGNSTSLVVAGAGAGVVANVSPVNSPAFSTAEKFAVTNEETTAAADNGLRELDEEGQRRLRAYLNQHEQMSRIPTGSQLVSFPGGRP